MAKITLPWLMDRITDEPSAYLFLEQMRWGDNAFCPHCHSTNVRYIRPLDGTSRKTRTGATSKRRVWKCRDCKKQFSVLTGTVFHGTKISIRTWVFVVFEMCASKNGVSAREIERKYGVTNKTAWFMLHRIRAAMDGDGLEGMLGGEGHVIVADETFIGGKAKNRHKVKDPNAGTAVPIQPGDRNVNPVADKTPVLVLIDTETGEARSRVINDVTGATLRKAIAEQVDMGRSTLHTDQAQGYKTFSHEFAAHETVNHNQDEYVRYTPDGIVTSNQAENFFSQLKRSLDGTHHHVSRKHLHRYLGEFDFRYSTRGENDGERFTRLLGQVAGVRLSWRPLTLP
jgi:transposase-like protein